MKNNIFLLICVLSSFSCEKKENFGPFESSFSGFWKLKEIQQVDGKIILSSTNNYFYNEWYGDVSISSTTGKDSLIFYVEKSPKLSTAIKNRIERDVSTSKAISSLDNGKFISIQSFTNLRGSDNYLEIKIADTKEDISKSDIQRYVLISPTRQW